MVNGVRKCCQDDCIGICVAPDDDPFCLVGETACDGLVCIEVDAGPTVCVRIDGGTDGG